jgi:GT2 family glycosyltransferase
MDAKKLYVVIPNWNGAERIRPCLDSLKSQSQNHQVVVVDNGSVDDSVRIIESEYPDVILVRHAKNKGFAGGVNAGIRYAMERDAKYVALLNNDAVAEKLWLKRLEEFLEAHPKAGIVTSKICDANKTHLDSTGDIYTIWGLPFPRGRGENYSNKYDEDAWIFGASGGASLYRVKMLRQIGLFDEDFFAYYEDVDISFRAQLAGWKVGFASEAIVYHEISATSSAIKGFATYQTLKNLPQLMWKNVPPGLLIKVLPRFVLLYLSIAVSALSRGQVLPVAKGVGMSLLLWPKKLWQRYKTQQRRVVPVDYIDSIIIHDLPPNAHKLRRLRSKWWKVRGRQV